MSENETVGQMLVKRLRDFADDLEVHQANEPPSGSPSQSVVQGRTDVPAPEDTERSGIACLDAVIDRIARNHASLMSWAKEAKRDGSEEDWRMYRYAASWVEECKSDVEKANQDQQHRCSMDEQAADT